MSRLDFLERVTAEPADATIIWLHGLGADGHDFYSIVPMLGLPSGMNIRFVFPHAPEQAVTINGGMVMRAWYDIDHSGIGPDSREDAAGMIQSAELITRLITDEKARGIPVDRIILAGFSQGGAVALYTGLGYPGKLAGILALSTYLPLRESLQAYQHDANRNTPVMMMHGIDDNIVPMQFAEQSRDFLRESGYTVEWYSYPMPHSVCEEQLRQIGVWVRQVL